MSAGLRVVGRRSSPALAMWQAFDAWADTRPVEPTLEEINAFVAGYRLEPDPLVVAYLAGQLARLAESPAQPYDEARRRAYPEALAPMELDRE